MKKSEIKEVLEKNCIVVKKGNSLIYEFEEVDINSAVEEIEFRSSFKGLIFKIKRAFKIGKPWKKKPTHFYNSEPLVNNDYDPRRDPMGRIL